MNVKQFIRVLVTVTAVLLTAAYAVAQGNSGGHGNGGGGGGGAGQNGGGVIYFRYDSELYTMNDDGSGVELVAGYPSGSWGEPSRDEHEGKRWFAQLRSVADEYYPDGSNRQEIVAKSDTGDEVLLDIEADLDPDASRRFNRFRWGVGDGFLSWIGRRWDSDLGQVVEGGLYVTPLEFDIDGNVGIGGALSLLVSRDLVDGYPDIGFHDWSPDGTAIVFVASSGLVIADLLEQTFDVVLSDVIAHSPRWSPGGDKLMLYYGDGRGRPGVYVMNIDGSGLKKVKQNGTSWHVEVGMWSPTGSHLLYWHKDLFFTDSYIVRTKSNGKGATRVTDESMGSGLYPPYPLGWRE